MEPINTPQERLLPSEDRETSQADEQTQNIKELEEVEEVELSIDPKPSNKLRKLQVFSAFYIKLDIRNIE
jgi:hypothetical protein